MHTSHLLSRLWGLGLVAILVGCSAVEPPELQTKREVRVIEAELIASDGSWGNTEGPAPNSSGALYFTSRGTYHGIVKWTLREGAAEYADVATLAGPGGLWVDADDNIYLTATGERKLQKLSPDGSVTTVAENFETDPESTTGPNDVTVSRSGVVYFTDPKGYAGEAAPGTIYRVTADGEISVFDDTVVGPNGIVLSSDDRTLYVAHNSAATTTNLVRWTLDANGTAIGSKELITTIDSCVGDGMAVDANGDVWVTCYSFGTAHLIDKDTGETIEQVTTEQKALTNCAFGTGDDRGSLYLTSSDMDRVTGYLYRAQVSTPGP
jgi:sugar lactone lactonase YvrE